MTIIKSEHGKVFGGYTDIPWSTPKDGDVEYKSGNGNSFIFSLRDDFNFVQLKCLDKSKEVHHNKDYLTSLGGGGGFYIWDKCNINTKSWSNLGHCGYYELPHGIQE